jgi:hypothetical protein
MNRLPERLELYALAVVRASGREEVDEISALIKVRLTLAEQTVVLRRADEIMHENPGCVLEFKKRAASGGEVR